MLTNKLSCSQRLWECTDANTTVLQNTSWQPGQLLAYSFENFAFQILLTVLPPAVEANFIEFFWLSENQFISKLQESASILLGFPVKLYDVLKKKKSYTIQDK